MGVSCDDDDPCTTDSCEGVCRSPCTVDSPGCSCVGGFCAPRSCASNADCRSAETFTNRICEASCSTDLQCQVVGGGQCLPPPDASGCRHVSACDDGNACTTDMCTLKKKGAISCARVANSCTGF